MWNEKFDGKSVSITKLCPYLLVALYQFGGSAKQDRVVEKARDLLDASDHIQSREVIRKNSPPQDYLESHFHFAMSKMRKTGYTKSPERGNPGMWEIGNEGMALAERLTQSASIGYIDEIRQDIDNKYSLYLKEKNKDSENEESFDDVYQGEELEEDNQIANDIESIVENIDPYDFELLCVKLLNKMGAEIEVTKRSSDHGIDGEGFIDVGLLRFKTVIQVKRYKSENRISEKYINNLLGAMHSAKAEKAIFITTSTYTKSAMEAARNNSIRLIDGEELIELMQKHEVGYDRRLNLPSQDTQ